MSVRKDLQVLIDASKDDPHRKNLSLNGIARSMGVSEATISQWMNNKYTGNNSRIEKKVRAYLSRYHERSIRPEKNLQFVDTRVSKKIFEIARVCHLENELGIVVGDSGIGKTRAANEYALQNEDVIMIESDLTFTAKVLVSEIARKVGLSGIGGLHAIFEEVVEKLKDSNRLIIVDEAEHQPIRSIDILRRIGDRTGCGILLVGLPQLLHRLRGLRGDYQYIYNRIGIGAILKPATEKDIELLVKNEIPEADGICKTFSEKADGSIRVLEKLLYRSRRMAMLNHCNINNKVIEKASEMLAFQS